MTTSPPSGDRSDGLPSAVEEGEWIRLWQECRDRKARDRLVLVHRRFAEAMASRFRARGQAREDLVQEALLGMVEAVDAFDRTRGVRFLTYARWWMRLRLCAAVERSYMLRPSRSVEGRRAFWRYGAAVRIVHAEGLDGDARVDRLATLLGVSRERARRVDAHAQSVVVSTAAAPGVGTVLDSVACPAPTPAAEVQVAHDAARAQTALAALTPRERAILNARVNAEEPASLEEVGRSLGLSRERARQIELGALQSLRKAMDGEP